ncbi:2503_t:CDS:2 [Cetraspora pellucida]|uniref:2503_t:CDS:1 n=1 Tax=Cetraspora pellucida TaxID=1433469 RepID=A0ACA9MS75_9GLOM|nr:2503_t:CDS:2 [Cetraspora pellucida]
MTIKLVGISKSSTTFTVIICLNELGLPYQLDTPVDFPADTKTEDYLANKHPFGKVPVLFDGDVKITESRAICRYLASKYQGQHNNTILIPNDVHKAGLVDQFISYQSFYYEPPVTQLLYQEPTFKQYHGKDSDPEVAKQAREEIVKVLDVYDRLLEGKEYLNGEYSLADLLHYPNTYYCYAFANHSDLWDKRPNVKKWWERLMNRDAWKKSLEDVKD